MKKYVCIHGHFYQPPRENPWLEAVELQDSAYPYHDWNERVTAECYGPNTASRILDDRGRITRIVNNYSHISFNFGPTLLCWLERHKPDFYQALLDADAQSRERFQGHGSAIAQVYNHMIMPLANTRDKLTQVKWGLRDFERRFGRPAEGMWLAETAVDLETLDILSDQGVKFTILAPGQAKRVRPLGEKRWKDVSGAKVDPKQPYLCRLPSGREIALFFYDGPIAQDLAFGDLLTNGERFARRLLDVFDPALETPQLVHVATDGESYGHHHRYGDMALTYCLNLIENGDEADLTIYGAFLAEHPPAWEVDILENTSWSCSHGVERWRSNCGCNTHPGWQQQWRAPLREGLDWLRDTVAPLYERELGVLLNDPWAARDAYIEAVLDRAPEQVDAFLARHARRELAPEERGRCLQLLEMQRHAMLMYTSCGWFFDEISGIETVQIMQYAARVMQLARQNGGQHLEDYFLKVLAQAPSNLAYIVHGARAWELYVRPSVSDLHHVGAHFAASSMFADYTEIRRIYCYEARSVHRAFLERGGHSLAVGRVQIRSEITREAEDVSYAFLHLGNHHLSGGVRFFKGEEDYAALEKAFTAAFENSDLPELFRLLDEHFDQAKYSLWHLFKDEQRRILDVLLASSLRDMEFSYRQIYERYYSLMQIMREMRAPLPTALATTMAFVVNTDMRQHLESEAVDLAGLRKLVDEVKRWEFEPDTATLNFIASGRVVAAMEAFARAPERAELARDLAELLEILGSLPLQLDVWKAQNLYYALDQEHAQSYRERAQGGDEAAGAWLDSFTRLGQALNVET